MGILPRRLFPVVFVNPDTLVFRVVAARASLPVASSESLVPQDASVTCSDSATSFLYSLLRDGIWPVYIGLYTPPFKD